MHEKFNLLTVQNELGYVFKDPAIVETAFVHKSYEAKGKENNVRLVFLGNHLLSFVLCDYITSRLPYTDEKNLTYQMDSYISELGAEKFLKERKLSRFVMLSQINEPIRESSPLGKEIFFAIIAAIYRDGGLPSLKSFLMPMIRACGGDDHYQPNLGGQVIAREENGGDSEHHIRSERLRRPAKSGSIGMSKAETVNATEPAVTEKPKEKKKTEKPEKAEKGFAKLLSKKKKQKEEPIIEDEPQETAYKPIENQKRFIRDPFAPVRLSDDLRNFKPKKPSKYDTEKESVPVDTTKQVQKPQPKEPQIKESVSADDNNYKSMLQELVQKNTRTANVLLVYKTAAIGNGNWESVAMLNDKVLAKASAQNKKNAEKAAAQQALELIKDQNSSLHKWFSTLTSGELAETNTLVDHISRLNQYMQKKLRVSYAPIAYERVKTQNQKHFLVRAVCNGEEIGCGSGNDFKEAKKLAAKDACEKLGILKP